jgi:hypothetical protein
VGSVSPIPVRTGLYAHTSSVLKQIILRKIKFKFIPIPENNISYNKFLESINWDLEKDATKKWPIIEKNGIRAIVGSAHQILTIDRDILFTTSPSNPSLTLVGGDSELNYVDVAIDKSGKLRLSTYNNFAYHIGNKVEDWMIKIAENNRKIEIEKTNFIVLNSSDLFNSYLKNKFYNLKKMTIKKVFNIFYKSK